MSFQRYMDTLAKGYDPVNHKNIVVEKVIP
jgi:hypothetical protein